MQCRAVYINRAPGLFLHLPLSEIFSRCCEFVSYNIAQVHQVVESFF
jgi:hypothetical protein